MILNFFGIFSDIFLQLENVGIFHKTPKSAAKHINDIWDNIDQWWLESETIKAKQSYCQNFANNPKHTIQKISQALML